MAYAPGQQQTDRKTSHDEIMQQVAKMLLRTRYYYEDMRTG
jgi:hypothetical protein